jgi:uncharacterized protein YbcC (UPF0753/DUF2309 family)
MHPLIDPTDIATLVGIARRVVPPAWSLDSVVAVNPLQGFEELPFDEALARAGDLYGATGYLSVPLRRALLAGTRLPAPVSGPAAAPSTVTPPAAHTAGTAGTNATPGLAGAAGHCSTELRRRGTAEVAPLVDAIVGHWCATHLAASHGDAGHRHELARSLYRSWRAIAPFDPDLAAWSQGTLSSALAAVPAEPAAAVAALLGRLGIDRKGAVPYLEAQCARLPGWVAALVREGAVVDLVALRLTVERLLVDAPAVPALALPSPAAPASELEDVLERAAWQAHAEATYRDALLGALEPRLASDATGTGPAGRPAAQVIFCIDVRSEGVRRHLEAIGAYETLGFAGFFGLPIAVHTVDRDHPVASCPVIVDPRATVTEQAVAGSLPAHVERDAAHRSFHGAQVGGASGFALADASGWLLGIRTLATAVAPDTYRRAAGRFWHRRRGATRTRFVLDPAKAPDGTGISVHDQASMAQGALTAMGLLENFAPVVVVCGHASANRNNPYRSALDCGACGGNPGGPNARILAAICNQADVRLVLAERGIVIPSDTWFVAAEHETTDDTITLLDTDDVPVTHLVALAAVERDLRAAAAAANAERRERLPAPPTAGKRSRRSADPAQVVPDWGLARCASIVVGPRSLTQAVDLDRRTFLHSYRPETDPEGIVLEAVMTGPVVVAHWISSQYYFSTVDPACFGAGSKPLHNVIERLGVAEGASLDLRIGLPLESVWFDGRPVHDPLRLLVVIDAPHERVAAIVDRNPVLQRLFDNGWARVVARDEQRFVERQPDATWTLWNHHDTDDASSSATDDTIDGTVYSGGQQR